jgi:hypothetical protein
MRLLWALLVVREPWVHLGRPGTSLFLGYVVASDRTSSGLCSAAAAALCLSLFNITGA